MKGKTGKKEWKVSAPSFLFRVAVTACMMALTLLTGCMPFDKAGRADVMTGGKTVLDLESDASDGYDRLLRFLGGPPGERQLYRNPKGEAWRPYFGGAWLDADKTLVIALTDDSPEIRQVFQEAASCGHLRYLRVKYSLDYLYEIYAGISEKQKENPFPGLKGYSLDVPNNRIEVHLVEAGEDAETQFLAWLKRENGEAFVFYRDNFTWFIRNQEDKDLEQLTFLIQSDLLAQSRLIQMGDPEGARRPVEGPTEQQLAEIEWTMQRKVENEPSIIKLDKQVVEEGDLVRLAYRAYTDSRYLDLQAVEIPYRCGDEGLPPLEAIQASVTPGRRVGETYQIEYTDAPYDTEEKVYCEITLLYIYRVEEAELNDEFVRVHTEYPSVEAWREALINMTVYEPAAREHWPEALKSLLADAVFELDEEKIESADIPIAALKIKALIQEYLLIQGVAEHYGIRAGEEEIQAYADKHYLNLTGLSRAARKACELRALRELVMDKMILKP